MLHEMMRYAKPERKKQKMMLSKRHDWRQWHGADLLLMQRGV